MKDIIQEQKNNLSKSIQEFCKKLNISSDEMVNISCGFLAAHISLNYDECLHHKKLEYIYDTIFTYYKDFKEESKNGN